MLVPSSSSLRSLSPRHPRRAEERSSNRRERSAEGGSCSAAVPPPPQVLHCPSTIAEVLHRHGLLFKAAASPLLESLVVEPRRRYPWVAILTTAAKTTAEAFARFRHRRTSLPSPENSSVDPPELLAAAGAVVGPVRNHSCLIVLFRGWELRFWLSSVRVEAERTL
ncbi:uncharacterized protein DS421_16g541860 [Arachis hypogaea]|nr:uncharacterized protein DS421_16g541860 [Arachis hypogaea]